MWWGTVSAPYSKAALRADSRTALDRGVGGPE
jgi:hypothetical protein